METLNQEQVLEEVLVDEWYDTEKEKPIFFFIKRCIDIILSLLGLIILSPVFLLIAILIKKEDHGNVFYKHKRIGHMNKDIYIYKFRSMTNKYKTFDSALADTDSIIIKQATDTAGLVYSKLKLEIGSTATPYMPSASELTVDDISEYFGYNYIQNQAYTYYGETNIDRLSRWDIKDEIFSFMGILYPQLPKIPTGVRFLDDIGNEYTAIAFKTEELQDYILINTDVNDETYQGWKGTTALNLFPVMDFERYRTRIIEKGQMELINLSKAEFKVKRKADFV